MNTWGEIKQATLNKLFLEEEEAQQQGYLAKFQYLANEGLNMIANGVKPKIATHTVKVVVREEGKDKADDEYYVGDVIEMPEDFLSFADIINYSGDEQDPEIVFITDNTIALKKVGTYSNFYNAAYEDITDKHIIENEKINIPKSVLNCLPSYIASQVLSQDDIQRSTVLKNEFELLLARLDTNVMYEANHFKSSGGWY
jgi:hypothetical protein